METLPRQFEAAVTNVTVSPDKTRLAIAAHTEVRELLESDEILKSWGVDSILIGSYARDTARHPGKDVDVFLRFRKLSIAENPEDIYNRVAEILIRRYGLVGEGGRGTLQARSVKVDFSPNDERADLEFSIDAVPAVPWGDDWGIPNRDRTSWSISDARWIRTNPVAFADESTKLSTDEASPTVQGRNAYKPIVRLLRQARHTHLGDLRPGGLYVEIAAFYAWGEGKVVGDSWATLLASSLREVATAFRDASVAGMNDPVLRTPLAPPLTAAQWTEASRIFGELADKADAALEPDECRAALLWREILGENERGPILPLPPGCAADGTRTPQASAVSRQGPDQARGFALIR
ncbi:nucleotidyltransferase domain-containing protein [Microbacterium azadirachtae]|uniref:nucleotidyltransferase domain-containing protein n=1 Tax=Microbacterium azadirachtae TaxID=582680 RepID=UPI0008875799|nr:nucleotidyltransferase [Microbacterium azadirachtae]SDM18339.1 hypothetical protein SAMN04488593_2883 [Microbacterium azadirachtae]SEG41235.1 hypothetical protein SAMN04488594_2868 [Microbacterium azadirachtae]SEG44183.1 hypothetical protein SAMN04488592_2877 [Microbacterium azadirachtae]